MCWRVKQTEGTNRNSRAGMKGSVVCWIHSLWCLKATSAIHLVTMLNVPCWGNGMSARTERVPKLWFSSVLRAECAVPLMWVKLVYQDAHTALQGCSRAGFLTGLPGLGLFSIFMKILENVAEEEHNSTSGDAGWACRHSAAGTCWICPLCVVGAQLESCVQAPAVPCRYPRCSLWDRSQIKTPSLVLLQKKNPQCVLQFIIL